MNQHPIEPCLKEALAAVRHAQDTRSFHRRRTIRGTKQREDDLQESFVRVKKAMVPLRSFLGAAPYKPQTIAHQELVGRVHKASKALQSERRKIWKMMDRRPNKEKANATT